MNSAGIQKALHIYLSLFSSKTPARFTTSNCLSKELKVNQNKLNAKLTANQHFCFPSLYDFVAKVIFCLETSKKTYTTLLFKF